METEPSLLLIYMYIKRIPNSLIKLYTVTISIYIVIFGLGRNKFHNFIMSHSNVFTHYLSPPLFFIEVPVPVPSQENER
jgi:hypothetical protein